MRIDQVDLHEDRLPLETPYVLSFTTVTAILSQIVTITLTNGARGRAETVALPGYSRETSDDICDALGRLLPRLRGLDAAAARHLACGELAPLPFALSPVLTALDLASGGFTPPAAADVPLVAPLYAADAAALPHAARVLLDRGYGTLKVKIGRDLTSDVAAARALLEGLPETARIRFDANEAYDQATAERFLEALRHPRRALVELVEQPVPRDDWNAAQALACVSPVPLMLDEGIGSIADVDRAAAIGAGYIKLKLFKNGGPTDVLALARRARERGLRVVLGNGVSADIGCLTEAWIYASHPDLFSGAGEMNGFVKITRSLLAEPPELRHGHLVWRRPAPKYDALTMRGAHA
jgi:L-alanine-DL-glutamate epimerase-like enolase superfamily enzyme